MADNKEHREGKYKIQKNKSYSKSDLKKMYIEIIQKMDILRNNFENDTLKDPKLIEHFKDDTPKNRFSDIMVAEAILAGIDLRNIQRENNNLDGELEEYPYNKKQIKMIHRYDDLQRCLDNIDEYAELYMEEEEEEEF